MKVFSIADLDELSLHYGNNIPVLKHRYKSFAVSC